MRASPAEQGAHIAAQSLLFQLGGPPEWTRRRVMRRDSRPEVAKKIGVHRQSLYDWEQGHTTPTGPRAERYLSYLLGTEESA